MSGSTFRQFIPRSIQISLPTVSTLILSVLGLHSQMSGAPFGSLSEASRGVFIPIHCLASHGATGKVPLQKARRTEMRDQPCAIT